MGWNSNPHRCSNSHYFLFANVKWSLVGSDDNLLYLQL